MTNLTTSPAPVNTAARFVVPDTVADALLLAQVKRVIAEIDARDAAMAGYLVLDCEPRDATAADLAALYEGSGHDGEFCPEDIDLWTVSDADYHEAQYREWEYDLEHHRATQLDESLAAMGGRSPGRHAK